MKFRMYQFLYFTILILLLGTTSVAYALNGDFFEKGTVYRYATYTNHSNKYGAGDDATIDINLGPNSDSDNGEHLYAPEDGTVTLLGYNSAYGNQLEYTSNSGEKFHLAHLQNIAVTTSGPIKGGAPLAQIGNSGIDDSTGLNWPYHLHLAGSGRITLSGNTLNPPYWTKDSSGKDIPPVKVENTSKGPITSDESTQYLTFKYYPGSFYGDDSDGWYMVTDCSTSAVAVTIPSTYRGKPVKSFDGSTFGGPFADCTSLKSVIISHGIVEINLYAFARCTALTSLIIPSSVRFIGEYAFRDCSALTNIDIPGSASLGTGIFYRCYALRSMSLSNPRNFGSGFTLSQLFTPHPQYYVPNEVYVHTFIKHIKLTGIWTEISDNLFSGCSALTNIDIPASVTRIGATAFSGCAALTSITIPEGVITIGDSAFYQCGSLSSVNIPSSVNSIGSRAFEDCKSLSSLTIPASVTSIGLDAFARAPITIRGYLRSYAQTYAHNNGIPFIALDAPPASPGDANGDNTIDIMDLVSIIDYIVSGTGLESQTNADANGDGVVDIMDLVWIIDQIVGG